MYPESMINCKKRSYIDVTINTNHIIIQLMELPQTVHFSNSHQSVFDQLLQQYSCNEIDPEESRPNHPQGSEEPHRQLQSRSNFWLMLDEVPQQNIVSNHQELPQADILEFKRVRSLREEQENKIAQFLREDRLIKAVDIAKNESPIGKSWQSLSPRKTKKIDKNRPMKAIQEYN